MECLKDSVSRQNVIKKIGLIVREEMKCMCSDRTNSVLISQEKTYLSMFSWDKLLARRTRRKCTCFVGNSSCVYTDKKAST